VSEQPTIERVKWFTLARKFPQLIGRTPDGARIPGGPYTITQAIGGLVVLVVGYYSMGLWANFGVLGNYVVLLSLTGAVVFGLGRIPLGSRNPAAIGMGAFRALSAPPRGRVRGRAFRIRRPRKLSQRVVICTVITPRSVSPPTTALVPVAAPVSEGVRGGTEPAAERCPVPPALVPIPVGVPAPAAAPELAPESAPHAPAPAFAVSVPSTVRAPRRPQSPPRSTAPQLTGVQALLASAGAAPKEN